MILRRIAVVAFVALLTSCGSDDSKSERLTSDNTTPKKEEVKKEAKPAEVDPMTLKGIGPIKSLTLGEIDEKLAEEGHVIFKDKCKACHKPTKKYIGPSPLGIMERRTPEWIMNMILNPDVMVKEDPIAKQLLAEYSSPMANQNLTEDEARAVLEYFRTIKKK